MIALAHMDMDHSSEKKNLAPNEKQKRSYLYKKNMAKFEVFWMELSIEHRPWN